jgi:hypothetical protein
MIGNGHFKLKKCYEKMVRLTVATTKCIFYFTTCFGHIRTIIRQFSYCNTQQDVHYEDKKCYLVVWAILEEGKQNIKKYSTQHLIIYYIINLLLELQNYSFNLTSNKLRTSVLS